MKRFRYNSPRMSARQILVAFFSNASASRRLTTDLKLIIQHHLTRHSFPRPCALTYCAHVDSNQAIALHRAMEDRHISVLDLIFCELRFTNMFISFSNVKSKHNDSEINLFSKETITSLEVGKM